MRGLSALMGVRGMAAAGVLAVASVPAYGVVYNDATGENHDGNPHMDIASVEVTNDATSISFKINLNGSIANPTDWGKYLIGFDTVAGGNTNQDDTGNGWSRSISMSSGMDYWSGSWVDSGGGVQLFNWNGTSWNLTGTPTHVLGPQSTTLTYSLASLGLSDGSTFNFDVYTSGGGNGDGANDASSNPLQASPGWPDHYNSTLVSTYTVVVPEPASAAMLGIAGLALLGRRRRA
jgi:hypothetical protein